MQFFITDDLPMHNDHQMDPIQQPIPPESIPAAASLNNAPALKGKIFSQNR